MGNRLGEYQRGLVTHMVGAAIVLGISMMSGCSAWQDGSRLTSGGGHRIDTAIRSLEAFSDAAPGDQEIANPPAKTIRFDGSEVVLGTNDVTRVSTNDFQNDLSSMLDEQKYFTATTFVAQNIETAEEILWDGWAKQPDSPQVRFIAERASQGVAPFASWNAMLASAKANPVAARRYDAARIEFTRALASEAVSSRQLEQLRVASQQLNQPRATVDALRLMAIGELLQGRDAWAESLLLQAIELAEQNRDVFRVADLWLLVAMHSSQSGENSEAAQAWQKAVVRAASVHVAAKRPVNVQFWVKAERHRPADAKWPRPAGHALMDAAKSVGCLVTETSPAELVVWCAVGKARLDNGEPQRALINFKKAESLANGDDKMWLRIAQSECLAALGQTQAAATLLSEQLVGDNPTLAAAANAALGSAKLRASSFQQGAQLLAKALGDSTLDWPQRSYAEADLALAMLIIGETDQGLKALHGAQSKFKIQGDTVALLQSLENEWRLLEHEGSTEAAKQVQQRILQIERGQAK